MQRRHGDPAPGPGGHARPRPWAGAVDAARRRCRRGSFRRAPTRVQGRLGRRGPRAWWCRRVGVRRHGHRSTGRRAGPPCVPGLRESGCAVRRSCRVRRRPRALPVRDAEWDRRTGPRARCGAGRHRGRRHPRAGRRRGGRAPRLPGRAARRVARRPAGAARSRTRAAYAKAGEDRAWRDHAAFTAAVREVVR